ncbi:MaoC family dehydratase N-terminal domain-containing protein [Microbacterium sp. H1-D42]|uniref:MaoC family dehydratase n=1 Tax=Microbacterium sp. H1-D42 TaxID=2925844 RepID=UPI001F52D57C|nr:MaoC family dehydratase N-terminal domain-containing protein [Microbacterium sp. H1-D42]UNK72227.1 MaoC family dehydratase N-terminal domain-containing protein [Microbacterium sp. H1-D42]
MNDISLDWLGVRTTPFQHLVGERQLMNFAAAVQSTRHAFYDDRAADGLAAFPTFSSYYSWRAVAQLWEQLRELGASDRVMNQQVHYRSVITNHREFVAGETVTVVAEVTGLRQHKAGTLLATTVDMRAADGTLICQELAEGMLRGIESPAGAHQFARAAAPTLAGPAKRNLDVRIQVGPLLAHQYDAGADIHFPIHTSARAAHDAGLPGIIVQGSATLGICVDNVLDWLLPSADRAFVSQVEGSFGTFLRPGTDVQLRAEASAWNDGMAEVVFSLFSQDEKEIIRNGYIAVTAAGAGRSIGSGRS